MTNNTNPFEGEELPPDPADIGSATLRQLAAGIDAGQLDDEEYQAAVRALEMLAPANRQPSSSDEALDWIAGEDVVLSRLALEYLTDRLEKAEPLAFTPWRSGKPPPRKWLIKEWLPAGRVVMLSGTGGAGKSRLALQLAAGIASGGSDRGEWIHGASFPCLALATTAPAPVVFASWEDEPEEFHRRLSELSGSNTPWLDFAQKLAKYKNRVSWPDPPGKGQAMLTLPNAIVPVRIPCVFLCNGKRLRVAGQWSKRWRSAIPKVLHRGRRRLPWFRSARVSYPPIGWWRR